MRTYSPDSPEAAARIVALMVLADGHVCRSEMQALDALHATAQLQLAPGALQAVLRGLAEDLQTHAYPQWGSTCQMDNQTLCALLDEVRDPALRQRVIDECLVPYLLDGKDAWIQFSDGHYERVPQTGHSAQQALMALHGAVI